ncbi:MAG: hypothetical protein ACREEZ_09390 [Stellaceae bacterium]
MQMPIHTDERGSPRPGTLRRVARALGARWARVTHLRLKPERNSWSEALRFPYF